MLRARDPRAQYTMGVMHRKGVAVQRDDREALLWFLAAAEAGHMLGQYAAGLAFDQGRGTDRDVSNALHYLQEAALNGHAAAPVQLGNIYFQGADPDLIWQRPISGGRTPNAAMRQGKAEPQTCQSDQSV